MLGWLLLGALLGAAVITICVPYLNKKIAKEKMKEKEITKGKIKSIITSGGVTHMKMGALTDDGTEQQIEFEVDDYDASEIQQGMTIYA